MITAGETMRDRDSIVSPNCVCCQRHLAEREEYCAGCQTPASLSHTVAARSGAQSFVSVLGASNAGKTVYLGLLLDILSKGSDAFRGTASNASSIDLQEQVITALERRSFPEKTPSEADLWKWMHCQVSMARPKGSHEIDLISPDFAGEAIAMEIQRGGTYPAIRHVVQKSTGLLLLCDSMRVRDEGSGEDLFAMKLASYIAEQHGLSSDRAGGSGCDDEPSIAIVFTKCDGCSEAMDDATTFAANNTPRLFEYCRRTFANHQYFAASVAGSSGMLADSRGLQMRVISHPTARNRRTAAMDRFKELVMVSQTVETGMRVEQAVFASTDRGSVKGYQLVARSLGVSTEVALELTRWAPTQLPSDAPDRGTISAWRLLDGSFAIARTVYGGPEYSNRGGKQVVTMFLVLRAEQIESYEFNPVAVARTAIAFGHLRLPLDMRTERLPTVSIPSQPLFRAITDRQPQPTTGPSQSLIDELAELVRVCQPFAVTGMVDPVDYVDLLISKLPADQRAKFSFTTGLSPSIRRPLQAHFYRYPDAGRMQTLQSQDVMSLSVNALSRDASQATT